MFTPTCRSLPLPEVSTTLIMIDYLIFFFIWKPIVSQICTETVAKVSECLSNTSEYERRASEKCSKACENSTERGYQFKYHCMWDSTHRELLEMCATPKRLFGIKLFSFLSIWFKFCFIISYTFKFCFLITYSKFCVLTVNIFIQFKIQHFEHFMKKIASFM